MMTDGSIRLFVGCAPNDCDIESQAVLEYSIRKHTSMPVEIEWMQLSREPTSPYYSDGPNGGWTTSQWATPFSGFRWSIPHRCGFEGRAIYADSDVIVLADLAELWQQPIPEGCVALGKAKGSWRYCVSLWNCAATRPFWPSLGKLRCDPGSHGQMLSYMAGHPGLVAPFEGDWNCLDGEGHADLLDGSLKALHYTDMSSQPQLAYALPRLKAQGRKHWFDGVVRPHPRADVRRLFDAMLEEAVEAGYLPWRYAVEPPYGEIVKKGLAGYRGRAR